jgi:hypothetical protein
MTRFLALTALLFATPALGAETAQSTPPLATYTAHFEVEVAGIKMGEIERRLKKHEGGLYEQTSLIYTTGLLSVFRGDRFEEHSLWRWQDNGPVPQRYTYHYSGGSKGEVYEQLDFDWQQMEVDSLREGNTTTLAIEPGVVDKLSYQVALVRDLRAGQKTFMYKVADRGDIRHIRYEVVGEELIETPWGEKRTLKVKRKTLTDERVTILWFAPALDYMVVQLIQNDNGTEMSARITDLRIDGMRVVEAQNGPSTPKEEPFTWPID